MLASQNSSLRKQMFSLLNINIFFLSDRRLNFFTAFFWNKKLKSVCLHKVLTSLDLRIQIKYASNAVFSNKLRELNFPFQTV